MLDRSHVAGGNLGRGCRVDDKSLGNTEGEEWLATGTLVAARAVLKPHLRYVALAAIEIAKSNIAAPVALQERVSSTFQPGCNHSCSLGLFFLTACIGTAHPLVP
jgi:hypothetical protein